MLNILFAVLYIGGVLLAITLFITSDLARRRGRRELKSSILKKIEQGILLSGEDVNSMARGAGLARASVSVCLNQLLLETHDGDVFKSLKRLTVENERTEPFEDLPLEVKPSLTRIQELITASEQKSDAQILAPIQQTLGTYVEQKADLASAKRVGRWVNLVSVIGFIVGLWGFYLAWKSPDATEMERIVRSAISAPAQKPGVQLAQ